jgi:hypothetical protein
VLTDLEFTTPENARALGYGNPRRLAQGVYEPSISLNLNLHLEFSGYEFNQYPFEPNWQDDTAVRAWAQDDHVADYGVCDRWEQIVEQWPQILSSERRFVISVTPVRRSDQPDRGGWRWHKWGDYIGTHEPQEEYLYDEVGIDQVWCFHIIEITGP